MSLTINCTEEKEANWADLIDGLRYGGFRRSVSMRSQKSDALGSEEALPGREANRKSSESEPN
jgi:hypothetical protein